MRSKLWLLAFWILFICWGVGAVLFMARVKGGFLTNYIADLTFPAWFYIYIRGLSRPDNKQPNLLLVKNWFGVSPERSFISILCVGTITEFKTYYLPWGIITGTFDYLDLLAYAIGLLICFYFDKKTNI